MLKSIIINFDAIINNKIALRLNSRKVRNYKKVARIAVNKRT